jgi:hypothetical protein
MTNEDRLLAALEYQRAMQPAFGNPNLMRQGRRMNLPARQVPGPVSEFGTQFVSFDQQPDQGYGTMAAEMALGFVPGVGQAMAVRDIERARRDDDPLGMALAGLSLVPFGKMIGAMRGGKQVGPVSQLDVYHGSPHKFDKFDASKIGTGEGAQAYGHGLYFAENPGVAQGYRDALQTTDTLLNGKKVFPIDPNFSAASSISANGYDTALAMARRGATEQFLTPEGRAHSAALAKQIEALKGAKIKNAPSGSLYKVDLPDAQIAKFLDWDKPLSQQSWYRPVADVVKEYKGAGKGVDDYARLIAKANARGSEVTGRQLYEGMLSQFGGSQAKVSEFMRDAGIPGIRYLDEGSRVGGKGTSNFVVFPGSESMLNILERNNQNVGNMMKQTVPAPSLMYKDPFGSTY